MMKLLLQLPLLLELGSDMVQQQLKLVATLSGQLQVHLASLPKKVVPAICIEIFSTLCLAHALRALLAEGQAQLWH